jgi:hypothetical protein
MVDNSTGRLHPEKYISPGHKHLALGNSIAEKEGFLFVCFQVIWGGNVVLKIQSGGQPIILQGDCIQKKISLQVINILLGL